MEVSRDFEISSIEEIKILSNVRLMHRRDLNPVYSKENLRVQFGILGDLRGSVTCYLCLDGHELSEIEKNYIYPLFVESMNILVGKQITQDQELTHFKIKLTPPKLSMIPSELNTAHKSVMQKYELEMEGMSMKVLTEYSIEAMN